MSRYDIYDEWDWADWEPGDTVIWDDGEPGEMVITHIDHQWGRVFWTENGEECMTRETNLIRIKRGERQ